MINSTKKITALTFCSILFCNFLIFSERISFVVPEDHEKLPLLDSLYNEITFLEKSVKTREQKFFRDPDIVSQKKFETKEPFYNQLFKMRPADKSKFLNLFDDLKRLYATQMNYFQELLSVLEGDDRVPCFALYRLARDNFGAIQRAIAVHTPQQSD